jgi:hypothetical protein
MAGGREDEGVAADARAARRARHDQDPGIELGLVRWADRIPFFFLPSFSPFPLTGQSLGATVLLLCPSLHLNFTRLWRFSVCYSGASLFVTLDLYSPGPFADSRRFSVAALPSADALRPAPAVAALLNASGSEDSHRGPYQQA